MACFCASCAFLRRLPWLGIPRGSRGFCRTVEQIVTNSTLRHLCPSVKSVAKNPLSFGCGGAALRWMRVGMKGGNTHLVASPAQSARSPRPVPWANQFRKTSAPRCFPAPGALSPSRQSPRTSCNADDSSAPVSQRFSFSTSRLMAASPMRRGLRPGCRGGHEREGRGRAGNTDQRGHVPPRNPSAGIGCHGSLCSGFCGHGRGRKPNHSRLKAIAIRFQLTISARSQWIRRLCAFLL